MRVDAWVEIEKSRQCHALTARARPRTVCACAWHQCRIVEFGGLEQRSDSAAQHRHMLYPPHPRTRQRVRTTWTAHQKTRQRGRRGETATTIIEAHLAWSETRGGRQATLAEAEAQEEVALCEADADQRGRRTSEVGGQCAINQASQHGTEHRPPAAAAAAGLTPAPTAAQPWDAGQALLSANPALALLKRGVVRPKRP